MDVICKPRVKALVSRTPRSSTRRVSRCLRDGRESREAGRMTYQPDSFDDLLQDACAAVEAAIDDGQKRMEVEFPPLPSSVSGTPSPFDQSFLLIRIQGIFG